VLIDYAHMEQFNVRLCYAAAHAHMSSTAHSPSDATPRHMPAKCLNIEQKFVFDFVDDDDAF
jgi:hypothetical protein